MKNTPSNSHVANYKEMQEDLQKIARQRKGPLADVSPSSYTGLFIDLMSTTYGELGAWLDMSRNDALGNSTAINQPAVYANARSMGYSIRRPVPSMGAFGARLKRSGVYSEVNVRIRKGTPFTVGGVSVIAAADVKFRYTNSRSASATGYMSVVKGDDGFGYNTVIEGRIVSRNFNSTGAAYQEFTIPDPGFCDWFGDHEPFFDEAAELGTRKDSYTVISSDALLGAQIPTSWGNRIYWRVDRYGHVDRFARQENPLQSYEIPVGSENYTAWVYTGNDRNPVIAFSNGKRAAIPVGIITVKYLSTGGASGVVGGIKDAVLAVGDYSGIVVTNEFGEISDVNPSDVEFYMLGDLTGGMDIESDMSIKQATPSAPRSAGIVSDYTSHEAYITKTLGFRFARVYGEDTSLRVRGGRLNPKYASMIRFSCVGDLYVKSGSGYQMATPDQYTLKGLKVPGLLGMWDYDAPGADFGMRLNYIPQEYFIQPGSRLDMVRSSIARRALSRSYYVYVPPMVHRYDVKIAIKAQAGVSASIARSEIADSVYEWAHETSGFSTGIFASKIADLVYDIGGTEGVKVSFDPDSIIKSTVGDFGGYTWNDMMYGSSPVSTIIGTPPSDSLSLMVNTGSSTIVAVNFKVDSPATSLISWMKANSWIVDNSVKLDEMCSVFWYAAFGNLLSALRAACVGTVIAADDLSEAMRRWEFTAGEDALVIPAYGTTVVAVSDTGSAYDLIRYWVEYIKVIRDYARLGLARAIIDSDGDLTRFASSHELVQLRVLPENISIKVVG